MRRVRTLDAIEITQFMFPLKLAVVIIDGVYLKVNIRGDLKNLTIAFMSVVLIESTGLYSFLWRMKYFFVSIL